MKKALLNFAGVIIVLYCFSVAIMAPYYNWQYAKENGFVNWLLFGEFVPTFKSLFWPYFVFFTE